MMKYLFMSNILFLMGMMGLFLVSKHIMVMLLSLELIFLAIGFNFIICSVFFNDMMGQFFVVNMLAVAASESSMGLAMLVVFYSLSGGISVELLKLLKN